MGVNSLPKTVPRQRRGCDLKPGRAAPESSTLTTWLPSHPSQISSLMYPKNQRRFGGVKLHFLLVLMTFFTVSS